MKPVVSVVLSCVLTIVAAVNAMRASEGQVTPPGTIVTYALPAPEVRFIARTSSSSSISYQVSPPNLLNQFAGPPDMHGVRFKKISYTFAEGSGTATFTLDPFQSYDWEIFVAGWEVSVTGYITASTMCAMATSYYKGVPITWVYDKYPRATELTATFMKVPYADGSGREETWTLSDPVDPRPTTDTTDSVWSEWIDGTPVAYVWSGGSSINRLNCEYKLVSSPALKGRKVRWDEVFYPADGSDAQTTSREWTISSTVSPAFGLRPNGDGMSIAYNITLDEPRPELAVDANRDGTIKLASEDATDATSADKPFRFWINDDDDGTVNSSILGVYTEFEQDDQLVSGESDKNCNDFVINGTRDLEDFARLWIHTQGLNVAFKNGDIQLGLKWSDLNSGSRPAIRIFKAADTSGGTDYLFKPTVASTQVDQTTATGSHGLAVGYVIEGTDPVILPKSLFSDLSESQPKIYLLFEGVKTGKGQLKLVILDKNGVAIGDGPGVWMDLKEPKDFIERWSCGDDALGEVQPVVRETANSAAPAWGSPTTDAEKDYVLYVHGYNMQEFEKQRWIETTFKRLYWLGYKGRVGGFTWPCAQSAPPYDGSEERAWQAAAQLKVFLGSLKTAGYSVHVIGHSQGNVVVGEALRQWREAGNTTPLVRTYIASQAAIQAHCYDSQAHLIPDFAGSLSDDGTLNVYVNYPPTGTTYLDVAAVGGAATNWINFENPGDYALTGNSLNPLDFHPGWQVNQRFKPDQGFTYNSVDGFLESIATGFTTLHVPADRFRIFSYAAEGRSLALGSTSTKGVFAGNNTDLSTMLSYGLDHRFHSAQFRASNAERYRYWQFVMQAADLTPLDP